MTECLLPFIAIGLILGMFLFIGLIIDPEGVEDWFNDTVDYWRNK